MNYATIKKCNISNGPGVRVSLFVSGCTRHCKDCFNAVTWDFNYGHEFTASTIREIVDALRPEYIRGLSILGGEPMEPSNAIEVYGLINAVRAALPNKSIWLYSGYTFEELDSRCSVITDSILANIDVLVDGPFQAENRDPRLQFRGSSNQRIILMPDTLRTNEVHLWQGEL